AVVRVHQAGMASRRTPGLQVEAEIPDHDRLLPAQLPAGEQLMDTVGRRLGSRIVASEHMLGCETFQYTYPVQRGQRHRAQVAREYPQPRAATVQLADQLRRPRGRLDLP